jgi:spermidine synthase
MYKRSMRASRATLVGVFLVCFANLLLEVLITRIFSATMFYHFTFMAVGLAMFGIAASGVYVFLSGDKLTADVQRHLRRHAIGFSIAAYAALVFATKFPVFSGGKVPAWSVGMFLHLMALIVLTALPFFFSGVVVALALSWFRDDVNRVYFYDLAGAAAAALLAGVVLGWLGGPSAILFVASVSLIAAGLLHGRSYARWIPAGLAVVFVVLNVLHPIVKLGSVKFEKAHLKYEKWNVFSRITVDSRKTIYIDAGASTDIHNLENEKPGLEKDFITAIALGTWETPPDNVLIIGPGGGRDVLFALSGGAKHVTGVEINPIIADRIMRKKYKKANGGLYFDPRVDIVVDEGRSFIRRSSEKYDMIQASLVDTWAATAAGAFALTENTLYTIEAFEDYYAHLTDRGVVTMTRFFGGLDGQGVAESPRLLILAGGALEKMGVAPKDVRKHIFFAVASAEPQGTLVAKRTEFTPDEIKRLEERAALAKMTVLVSPNTNGSSQLEKYLDNGAWSDVVENARDELTPPTDDRPFFFFFKKFPDLFQIKGKQIYDPGLWVLVSLGSVLFLGLLFILLPLVVRLIRTGMPLGREEPRAGQLTALTYFGVVGFAFMAVEIALMQRFTLFVGHPSYSLLVVLFSVLLSTAFGARLTVRFDVPQLRRVMMIAGLALAAVSIIYGLVLGDLLRAMIGLERPVRIVITALLVAPCGLLMGAMVPSVIRVLGASRSALVPWGWGINGATSVIGTSIATIVAMYGGFTMTFMLGAATYALAGVLGARVSRHYR